MGDLVFNLPSYHYHRVFAPAEHGMQSMQSTDVDQFLQPEDIIASLHHSIASVQHADSRLALGSGRNDGDRTTATSDREDYFEIFAFGPVANAPTTKPNEPQSVSLPTSGTTFESKAAISDQEYPPDTSVAPASTRNPITPSMQAEASATEDSHGDYKSPVSRRSFSQTSETNGSHGRSNEKQKKREKVLSKLRWHALENRLMVREMRRGLQNQRRKMVDAEVKFTKALQVFAADNPLPQDNNILELFEECQKARDAYQPLENSYNDAENLLDQKDFQLGEIEKKFNQPEGSQASEPFDLVGDTSGLGSLENSSIASADSMLDFNGDAPVVLEYFSRIGDRDLIWERLDDLRRHRAELVESRKLREPFGISLDPESVQFLFDFDSVHTQIQAQLADVEADISRLGTFCEKEGFLNSQGAVQTTSHDEDEGLDLEGTRIGRDPFLIQESNDNLRFSDISHGSTETRMNKAKFINRWLLLGLRGSSLEMTRLKSMPDLRALNVNEAHLNELVLEWWPKDTATEALLSRIARPPGQSLTATNQSEERITHTVSLGQPRKSPFLGSPFSLNSV